VSTRSPAAVSALDELLRRIEDAIDATSDRVFAGQGTATRTTRDTGPAIVRAVLEQPLPDVDVCPDCRGIGHRIVDGTRSPVWCRPCNGIGYVEQQQLDAQLTPAQHCPTCSHIPHGTGPCSVADCACYAGQRCPCGHATACSDPAHCVVP